MKLGEKIRTLRKGKYTQEELAYRIGVHTNTLLRWEKGIRSPKAEQIRKLANELGTTVSNLVDDVDEVKKENSPMNLSDINKSEFMERLVRNQPMIVYETGNERMLIPATSEGFNFIRELRSKKNAENFVPVR